jgi:hypothetical protein
MMPAVFNLPGVPALSSYLPTPSIPFLADVAATLVGALIKPIWGIFLNGIPVLIPDSFVSFDFRQDYNLPTYPLEKGAFQTYNKVQLPAEIRVRMSAGGTIANRSIFEQEVDQVMRTTELYDVVTPEKVYLGYNFHHKDISRTNLNGVGLLVFDLWLQQIGDTVTTTFSSTMQPGDAGTQAAGNIQPVAAGQSVLNGIAGGFR